MFFGLLNACVIWIRRWNMKVPIDAVQYKLKFRAHNVANVWGGGNCKFFRGRTPKDAWSKHCPSPCPFPLLMWFRGVLDWTWVISDSRSIAEPCCCQKRIHAATEVGDTSPPNNHVQSRGYSNLAMLLTHCGQLIFTTIWCHQMSVFIAKNHNSISAGALPQT